MFDLTCLVKRNIYKFLRDKTAVFFSFLSVIILLALYFLFIGRQYTTGGQLDLIDENLRTFLGVSIIMGGVLVINTISLSLGVMGNVITDLENRRLDGFLVTPVKRYKIILSYYLSAIIVTAILSLLMWFLTILYVGLISGYWYSFSTIIQASGLIIFYTFISASLMIFLTTLMKSVNAFGALSGILGTIVGFISGIYMPLFVLGKSMTYVASVVPFTHMTIVLKQVLLKEPYRLLALEVSQELVDEIELPYGTLELGVFGQEVNMWIIMGCIIAISFILMLIAYKNMTKKIKN
ncbi:ABC transporter permease [Peloplasma aerotolerans]|uniref:ABC transporter permease n=1 Tax=Peloplasma aerotolerans TaxID=3044389 RepID=A0AAW6U534_9MOLU|nr:ABC transporter permease [Mariniplasma sp. M4Ah]MDI6452970.1 ABC transporter permease [Mariniplasma sp. M4Ah]